MTELKNGAVQPQASYGYLIPHPMLMCRVRADMVRYSSFSAVIYYVTMLVFRYIGRRC